MRLTLEIIGLLFLSLFSFLLWMQAGVPTRIDLPHYNFNNDAATGKFWVVGTWALEDASNAWPTQSTTIECNRRSGICLEVTAVIADDKFMMPLAINRLKIDAWSSDSITISGIEAACITEHYQVSLLTKTVTGLVQRKADCPGEHQKRMRMIDPRELVRAVAR